MKTLTFCSVFEKIRVRTERIRTAYARRPENAQEMEIYRARRQRHIRKSVLVPSARKRQADVFKKLHSGNCFRKPAFLVLENALYAWTERLNGYVWTGPWINPLSPESDQHEISPCKINAL